MDFERALRLELTGTAYDFLVWDDSHIANSVLDRVYPVNAPEGTAVPYLTYETSDHAEKKTMEGYGTTGTLECTVDVFDKTYSGMKELGKATKEKIKTFMGRNIGEGAGPYIQNVTFDDLLPEFYEPNVDLYRKSITFTVFY